ncbi:hypothetical protein M440DRAFT_1387899 [Trichoderma longibrachiatum ATCC 18648]|uniref:Uncharacterized protein n=1 Tax=Trichoderma longibrachiatum ATCC 18648 TaxID=983965 RepID=A0A2T4CIU0_TRILO|nr:hypothetical protein M440DRAFT_1387899 [Trichoderma longibrachiatum ATCC 18648]
MLRDVFRSMRVIQTSITRRSQTQCAAVNSVVETLLRLASPQQQDSPSGQMEPWCDWKRLPVANMRRLWVPIWCQIHRQHRRSAQPSHHMPPEAFGHCSSRAVVQQALSQSTLAVGRRANKQREKSIRYSDAAAEMEVEALRRGAPSCCSLLPFFLPAKSWLIGPASQLATRQSSAGDWAWNPGTPTLLPRRYVPCRVDFSHQDCLRA